MCPFSTWSNGSTWQPTLYIGNHKIWAKVASRLLRVILDRSLTFNAHLKKLTVSLSFRVYIIRATVHTSWGWNKLIHNKSDYAGPAWQPWLSATNLSCLERLQNRSLQLITGQLVSTPSDIQSYHTCSNRLFLKSSRKGIAKHRRSSKTCCFSYWHPSMPSKFPQLLL